MSELTKRDLYGTFGKENLGVKNYTGDEIIYMKRNKIRRQFEWFSVVLTNNGNLEFWPSLKIRSIIAKEKKQYSFSSYLGHCAFSLKGNRLYTIHNNDRQIYYYRMRYDQYHNLHLAELIQTHTTNGIEFIEKGTQIFLNPMEIRYVKEKRDNKRQELKQERKRIYNEIEKSEKEN
jgi:carboxylesterase type B